MDNLTKEQRTKNMKAVRSRDTKIEFALRKALWKKGYRYRKNYTALIGKPDIVITKYKIAIFCDSEFFHGKGWPTLEKRILKGSNSAYWHRKIKRNIERDAEVNRALCDEGWIVLRFWGKDIQMHLDECVKAVDEAAFDRLLEDNHSFN